MTAVYFRGTRYAARQLAIRLVAMLTGREPDSMGLARGVFSVLGYAALSDIKDDFVRKAAGGTGEDGVKWPPLSPRTIAGRRLGPKDLKLPHIANRLKAEKEAAAAASKQFTKDAAAKRKQLVARFSLSMPLEDAKRKAAEILKAERDRANFRLRGQIALVKLTGQTRAQVLSMRKVEMLRDTGVLLNSLSPGELGGGAGAVTYTPPGWLGGDDQVFKLFDSGVIVGTTVAYAKTHQEGDASRHIPARPFLPTRGVPRVWAERWAEAGGQAVEVAARMLFQQGLTA